MENIPIPLSFVFGFYSYCIKKKKKKKPRARAENWVFGAARKLRASADYPDLFYQCPLFIYFGPIFGE
jgi:hypothetical protein